MRKKGSVLEWSRVERKSKKTHGDESPLEEVELDRDRTPGSRTEELLEEFEGSVAETSVRDGFLRSRDESNEVADDGFSETRRWSPSSS